MKATSEYFSSKKEEANKEFKYFKGVDENCNAFNNKNMFDLEQVNSFSGFKGEDRLTNFSNAGGCNYSFSAMKGSMNMRNAAGVSRPMPTPSYRGGVVSPVVGGASKRRKKRPSAQTTVAPVARQRQIGDVRECTPPSVFCKAGDYLGCHPAHKCNSSLRQRQIGGAKQVNKKSRRRSSDRIAVKPVMGQGRKSNFAAAARVFPEGQGNYFNGAASSKCGLDR